MSEVPFHIWVAALFTLRNWRRARKAHRRWMKQNVVRVTPDTYVIRREPERE